MLDREVVLVGTWLDVRLDVTFSVKMNPRLSFLELGSTFIVPDCAFPWCSRVAPSAPAFSSVLQCFQCGSVCFTVQRETERLNKIAKEKVTPNYGTMLQWRRQENSN